MTTALATALSRVGVLTLFWVAGGRRERQRPGSASGQPCRPAEADARVISHLALMQGLSPGAGLLRHV